MKRAWVALLMLCMASTQAAAQNGSTPTILYVPESKVVADGIIVPDEYGFSYMDQSTGMTVHWEHDGTIFRVGLVSPGSGWVSMGFGPRNVGMDGADMILAYTDEENSAVIVDEVGVGHNHLPDTERGGSDDILEGAVSQLGNVTAVEFSIPLDSGDALDRRLQGNGTYGFFLGYQSTARDRVTYHTDRSETMDVFVEPVPGVSPLEPGFPWVAALGVVSALTLVVLAIHLIRRPKVIRFKPRS